MEKFKKIVGIALIIGAIAAGIWVDIVVLMVGGIQKVLAGLSTDPWNGEEVGWGVVHVAFSGVGLGVTMAIVFIGISLYSAGEIRRSWRK